MSSSVFIKVPDDCGTLSVGLNQTLYLVFTQNINFQCNNENYFNPPIQSGIKHTGQFLGPLKPIPQFDGQSVTYTHPGTADHCPPPPPGQAGIHALTSHVIHIGSGPLVLTGIIEDAEKTDRTLREAWPATKLFVNFLLSQNTLAVPDSAKSFLGELRTAGDQAFDRTRK